MKSDTGDTSGSDERAGARARSRRLLLVEDDSSARFALEALLADEGYEVRSAADGEAALLTLRGWTPDVVVSDLKLPKVDGVELMAALRQRLPGVPVIIMTGFGSIEHAVETMHLGAADYLPKPLALDRLLAALDRVLRRGDDGLAIGEVVGGRYRIDGKLGEGAMGAVYRATQRGLERPVALKVIHTHNHIADARARLLREARAASALGHPNAVKIYDVGEDRGLCFLAMELLEGHDLSAEVEPSAPLDLARIYAVALEIASVLVTAHTIGLVHRDLKPENIFIEVVGRGERVRVLDFGIAFLTEGDGEAGRLTQEGVIVGTPLYLAPEQAAGRAIGPSADIYAFGCLLYEMVTGDVPFRGSNMEVLSSHLRVTPPPPHTFRPELPAGLDALIMAMLRKAPSERPSAAEVEAALRRLAAGEELAVDEAAPAIDPHETTLRGQLLAPLYEPPAPTSPRLLLLGALPPAIARILQIEGYTLEELRDARAQLPGARCILACDAPIAALRRAARLGVPLIADCRPGDVARSRDLRDLEVAAALRTPLTAASVLTALRELAVETAS